MTAKPLDEVTITTKGRNSRFNNCSRPQVHTINTMLCLVHTERNLVRNVNRNYFVLEKKYFRLKKQNSILQQNYFRENISGNIGLNFVSCEQHFTVCVNKLWLIRKAFDTLCTHILPLLFKKLKTHHCCNVSRLPSNWLPLPANCWCLFHVISCSSRMCACNWVNLLIISWCFSANLCQEYILYMLNRVWHPHGNVTIKN